MYALILLNFIVPFVMVSTGNMLNKRRYSMNTGNGYNTPVSRRSQMHWDYAQNIAPGIFITRGKRLFIIEIIISITMFILRFSTTVTVIAGECVGVLFLLQAFYYTDLKIKEKFPEDK